MKRNSVALKSARQHLHIMHNNFNYGGTMQVPGVRSCALQAGVSVNTMCKAIAMAVDDGWIKRNANRTFRFSSHEDAFRQDSDPKGHTPENRASALARRIDRDIMTGVYRQHHVLPGIKELCAVHGAGHRLIVKSLLLLEQQGRITRYKRTYQIGSARSVAPIQSIVLIANADPYGSIIVPTGRTNLIIHSLENECSRRGIDLVIIPYRAGEFNTLLAQRIPHATSSDRIAGFIILAASMQTENIHDILGLIAPFDKPLSILHEGAEIDFSNVGSSIKAVQVFSIANSVTAGIDVGRFLLDNGHRHIAYVSPVHNNEWSERRLEGIRSVFKIAGAGHEVSAHTRMLEGQWEAKEHFPGLTQKQDLLPKRFKSDASPADRIVLRALGSIADQINTAIEYEALRMYCVPLFETILAKTAQATAWVVASDGIGLLCLDFLATRNIPVPGAISVVSFDNSMHALARKLTSYDFNDSHYAHAMLDHITQSVSLSRRRPIQFTELPGTINQRGSVGNLEKRILPNVCTDPK